MPTPPMITAETADQIHELIATGISNATVLYKDNRCENPPARDIAAGIVLRLILNGFIEVAARPTCSDPAHCASDGECQPNAADDAVEAGKPSEENTAS